MTNRYYLLCIRWRRVTENSWNTEWSTWCGSMARWYTDVVERYREEERQLLTCHEITEDEFNYLKENSDCERY